ncbi:DUF3363 domain-containing protein [Sphingomonas pruni]|uniref:DUF3363 domain-containing protein n=1 Tax=Sphingomonas pruni TaxID=40683 RepID=UPI0008316215|nr:DUF3363 domain-containing protein [Sphingomonas pruni]
MDSEDDDFEPRLGRMRPRGRAPRLRAVLVVRVRRAASGTPRYAKAPSSGRFNQRGRGARVAAALPRDNGWSFDRGLGLNVRARRVAVKVRVVKLGGKLAKVTAHLRYIERDGVARDGAGGRLYSTFSDDVDGETFVDRQSGDRHQFRLIVSPEDGKEFADLRPFTRDLMAAMERDLGTTLDWVAVDHHDTGHPHTHIVIRGRCEDGRTLNIAGDYIAHGIRHRASEIMTRALGPQTERDVADQLAREVDADRFTRLDRALLGRASAGLVDLRFGDEDPAFHQMLVGRARALESLGLAKREEPLTWRLDDNAGARLTEMGRRGDIIRTMHHEMQRAAIARPPELYALDSEDGLRAAVVGRLIRFGASDEFHDRRFALIDGIDGYTHHVDIGENRDHLIVGAVLRLSPREIEVKAVDRTVAQVAAAHGGRYSVDLHLAHDPDASEDFAQSHIRRLEALRRAGAAVERETDGTWRISTDHIREVEAAERRRIQDAPVVVEHLSREPLARLVTHDGPTLLDRELVGERMTESAGYGFGEDWRTALDRRRQWLIEQDLAEAHGQTASYRPDLIQRLRTRELSALATGLSTELGLDYREAVTGDRIAGRLTRDVQSGGNRYALIERAHDFTLLPWRDVLDRQIGKPVSGIVRPNGVSWTLGRDRAGPSIS